MIITKPVYRKILQSYPVPPPEQGGILGGTGSTVTEYFHDSDSSVMESFRYIPNTSVLNRVLVDWNRKNISFLGMIHSHPPVDAFLSEQDLAYANVLVRHFQRPLYFLIIIPNHSLTAFRCEWRVDDFQTRTEKIIIK